jgi:rhodanese-related sulfurtransferase
MLSLLASGILILAGMSPVSQRGDMSPGPRCRERQVSDMGLSASQMVATAKSVIEQLSPDAVAAELQNGTATLIDVRERHELAMGRIPQAHHAPRGMLEFYADPTSPYHRAEFDPRRRIILMCDSGSRSALAVETLQRMGYGNSAQLKGGINAWIDQGFPVERDP